MKNRPSTLSYHSVTEATSNYHGKARDSPCLVTSKTENTWNLFILQWTAFLRRRESRLFSRFEKVTFRTLVGAFNSRSEGRGGWRRSICFCYFVIKSCEQVFSRHSARYSLGLLCTKHSYYERPIKNHAVGIVNWLRISSAQTTLTRTILRH